jgi:D-2-hydroxyacid dehydrogenase (NADP+)
VTVGIVGLGSIGQAVGALATAFGCRVIATRRSEGSSSGATSGATGGAATVPPGGGVDDRPAGEVRLDRVFGPEGLPDLLAESDFVVLAAPLTPETENMINDESLDQFKRTAWLINVARGRLVDERALLRALREGRLGGAILDAFRDEPLPPASPLYDLPNVIITPHTSWSSGRVLDRSMELFCDNLRRYAAGEPLLNVVDPRIGY